MADPNEKTANRPRNIIVSGGSRGLGLAIVSSLLNDGHRVATFSRSESDELSALRGELDAADRLHYERVDAADSQQLVEFVKSVTSEWETLDVLINNAGVAHDGVFPLVSDRQIEQMLDVNLKGALTLARECSRVMLDQASGSIINISSIIAERGFAGLAVYASTKAALIGFTRSLARELGRRHIRVNAIAPGYLETEMSSGLGESQREQIIRRTPLGRLGTARDVLGTIDYLISPASDFVTGQVFVVDGGASL